MCLRCRERYTLFFYHETFFLDSNLKYHTQNLYNNFATKCAMLHVQIYLQKNYFSLKQTSFFKICAFLFFNTFQLLPIWTLSKKFKKINCFAFFIILVNKCCQIELPTCAYRKKVKIALLSKASI
jgi:hypothetical protein